MAIGHLMLLCNEVELPEVIVEMLFNEMGRFIDAGCGWK
jgi:hypothetical protein